MHPSVAMKCHRGKAIAARKVFQYPDRPPMRYTNVPADHKAEQMEARQELNRNLAQMLKGGVIMDVTTPEQAKIAEAAGACAVMALERIPADIRAAGGVSRMSDPAMIKGIQAAVSIPVMAKCA